MCGESPSSPTGWSSDPPGSGWSLDMERADAPWAPACRREHGTAVVSSTSCCSRPATSRPRRPRRRRAPPPGIAAAPGNSPRVFRQEVGGEFYADTAQNPPPVSAAAMGGEFSARAGWATV